MRIDKRRYDEIREIRIRKNFQKNPEGSVLISCGNTRVLCSVSIEEKQPNFLKGTDKGWLTAEYIMHPRSSALRTPREGLLGIRKGRSVEIQRLIGRTLRSVCDLKKIGPQTIYIDCDVLDADGGTRTTAINGAFIALLLAEKKLLKLKRIQESFIMKRIASISTGIVEGKILLDLNAYEDNKADADMNVVMDETGRFAEIQVSGEEYCFDKNEFNKMLSLAEKGIRQILLQQKKYVK